MTDAIAMPLSFPDLGPPADRMALARLGETVRARLAQDPSVWMAPVQTADFAIVENFLTADECAAVIAMVDKVAVPSATYNGQQDAMGRTSYSGDVERWDPLVMMVERRIDDLLGIAPSFGETMQGQRYQPGQEFRAHYDWFATNAPYWQGERGRGGQRSWTAMIYLNDVEEGGQTVFGHLGITATPKQGMLLAWNNANVDGTPNYHTIHAANPVVRGVKYVITKWYRSRAWGGLSD